MARRQYAYCSQSPIAVCPNAEGIWLERGEREAIVRVSEETRLTTSGLGRRFLHRLEPVCTESAAGRINPTWP